MDAEDLMPAEHSDHFTQTDRERLITTKVNLENLTRSFDDMKRSIESQNRHTAEKDDRVDGRLRALENFRWWILGAAAASGFGGSFVARLFHP